MNRMQDSVYHHVGHCEDVRTMCCNNEPGARWPHNCHINVGWYLNLAASPWLPHLILVAGWASGWRAVCWLLNVCIPPGNVGGSQVSKPWRYYPFKISKNYPRPLPSLTRVFSSHSQQLCTSLKFYVNEQLDIQMICCWLIRCETEHWRIQHRHCCPNYLQWEHHESVVVIPCCFLHCDPSGRGSDHKSWTISGCGGAELCLRWGQGEVEVLGT